MCRDRPEAERALATLRLILAELGLAPKETKTRIVGLRDGGEGFDFLGFEHRWVRARGDPSRAIAFRARWPSRQGMQHARDRIRELTARERLLLPVETVVQDVNRFLRPSSGYFRYGNSARPFDRIQTYALGRLVGRRLPVIRSAGPDQPQRGRRRAQTQLGLAGKAECRR